MMGWRVGYLAYPDYDGMDTIGKELLKVQDTVRNRCYVTMMSCMDYCVGSVDVCY